MKRELKRIALLFQDRENRDFYICHHTTKEVRNLIMSFVGDCNEINKTSFEILPIDLSTIDEWLDQKADFLYILSLMTNKEYEELLR